MYNGFEPFFGSDAKILILGSFPSVRSREQGFYYGHPQNRFWRVLASVFEDDLPSDIEKKKLFLKKHNIALWDTAQSCEITGSSDSSIKNVKPADLSIVLKNAPGIERIFLNGQTAAKLYKKHIAPIFPEIPATILPSTSPANARYSLASLCEAWKIIKS
ncbi:MAG: DNA-deoxyinosine glycosylase [Firmicutes bacterium]|nr:DNA-deoxyinosine glycosylase [Bacillota bacterium]